MSEWKEYMLSDLMDIIGGGTPKTSIPEYWSGSIPWLSVVDFGNENKHVQKTEKYITELGLKSSSTKILRDGQIIISARGTVGELAVIKGNMAFNQSCYGLTAKESICHNDFLYYLLKCKIVELKRNAHGAVFDTITRTTFDSISAIVPDLPTQTVIAEILSSLDDKIELNNKINQELENLAQTLFKQWFIDFEFPNENGEPYKSSGGEMVESELGEIPKGWEVNKLKEVTKQIKPGTNFQPKRTSIGIPFLNVRNINSGFIDTSDSKLISNEDYHSVHKVWQPEKMDILISRIGTLGLVAPILDKDLPIAVHYNFILIKPGKLNSKFLYFLLKSDDFQLKYKSLAKASVQEYVTIDEVQDIEILMPDDSLLSNFKITFDSLFDKIESSYLESQELIKLRNTLLPKLISGELEINEINN